MSGEIILQKMAIRMKRSLLLLILCLQIIHTGAIAQSKGIMFHRLTEKKGLMYAPGQKKSFTGGVFANYRTKGRKLRGNYKNGLRHGIWTYWSEDGKKNREESYKCCGCFK